MFPGLLGRSSATAAMKLSIKVFSNLKELCLSFFHFISRQVVMPDLMVGEKY